MVQIVFYLFILFTLGSALAVLLTKNVLYAAFFLLLTLLGVAGLFVLAGADFLAVSQIMIYMGGVLVLVIFGVMLTHKADAPQTDYTQPNTILIKHRSWLWALVIAGGIFSVLYTALVRGNFVLLGQREVSYRSTVDTIGRLLMTEYLIPFEIAGVLLLVALIGATTIAASSRTN
ncbi:NADH-quinone oxidoreductase subunit J family protein [Larkinella terrae]|uniref:NADH-quinone oxidoreductase subunit J n=1 Tax=Larkinella terrae TaxID=2025311 RepID=A0A7K0EPM9_9BACT|nr:NADH-quinone oxidoreductase subunit J [Larkinella terrae]MRS63511.1 NADH-quinone oxidoreductase subunit J [Larkinella terrae]